jgi:hypothetical protein
MGTLLGRQEIRHSHSTESQGTKLIQRGTRPGAALWIEWPRRLGDDHVPTFFGTPLLLFDPWALAHFGSMGERHGPVSVSVPCCTLGRLQSGKLLLSRAA